MQILIEFLALCICSSMDDGHEFFAHSPTPTSMQCLHPHLRVRKSDDEIEFSTIRIQFLFRSSNNKKTRSFHPSLNWYYHYHSIVHDSLNAIILKHTNVYLCICIKIQFKKLSIVCAASLYTTSLILLSIEMHYNVKSLSFLNTIETINITSLKHENSLASTVANKIGFLSTHNDFDLHSLAQFLRLGCPAKFDLCNFDADSIALNEFRSGKKTESCMLSLFSQFK